MKNLLLCSTLACIAIASPLTHAQDMDITNNIPACTQGPGKAIPDKYERLAKRHKNYAWLLKSDAGIGVVSGKGSTSIDDPDMSDWLTFYRVDIDNDGICDWYIEASASLSTGGDRDSINTLYLKDNKGWIRIGASVPAEEPDELRFGKTNDEQEKYMYGEDIASIYDKKEKKNYFITAFHDRHVKNQVMPGYRIYTFDNTRKNLKLLDKWEPNSKASMVYAYFKQNGARTPGMLSPNRDDTIEIFDPEIESYEIEQVCNPKSTLLAMSEYKAILSKYLLSRCNH